MSSPWKVILATIVIFATGVITGAFVSQRASRSKMPLPDPAGAPQQETVPTPWFVRREFLDRMDRHLNLSREQYDKIARILQDSQERTHIIVGLVAPEIQQELREVRQEIRAELTPEQRQKFEELQHMMRPRGPGQRGGPFGPGGPGPNFRPNGPGPRPDGAPPPGRPDGPE